MPRGNALAALLGAGARAAMTPAVVKSRSWHTFTITITLGEGGLANGDTLAVVHGAHVDRWQFMFASHVWGTYQPWQCHDPAAPGFVTVACSRPGVEMSVRVGEYGGLKLHHNEPDHLVHSLHDRARYVLEAWGDQPLRKGDTVTITYGDTRWGSPGAQASALALPFYFLPFLFSRLPRYDRDLPTRQGDFDALPCVRVTGGAATRLHLAAQPLLQAGERFVLHCAAVDAFGNRDESFTGAVTLRTSSNDKLLPARIVFKASDRGSARVAGLRLATLGWQTLHAECGALRSPPLPLLVGAERPAQRIYFGEMHGHTLDCDATFPAWVHYEYARRTAGLDFAACASHAEYFGCKAAWERYLDATAAANAPGEFATFFGYEWAGEGHTNAYFLKREDAANLYGKRILKGRHPADAPSFRTVVNRERPFLAKVRRLGVPALCIAHYHARYVDPVDDGVLRLHEVYSMHQQNTLDAKFQDALGRGIRVGAVCGSDSHRLPIGSLCPDPDSLWRQPERIDGKPCSVSIQKKAGIQATFAKGLDRAPLWEGMMARRTYGTTGARMALLLWLNGVGMGGEVALGRGERPRLTARIGCQAPIAEVELFRFSGGEWRVARRWRGLGALTADLEHADRPLDGGAIYYLRVRQEDNERGWTSPIWARAEAGGAPKR